MRRPWKERLAKNCDEISKGLKAQYLYECGVSAEDDPEGFLDWIGLKRTKTALKRIRNPLK